VFLTFLALNPFLSSPYVVDLTIDYWLDNICTLPNMLHMIAVWKSCVILMVNFLRNWEI